MRISPPLGQHPRPETFRRYIFSWWAKNRRDLPWRHTKDPYSILVSEVMLQQTQVSRVLPKYLAFIAAYPTAHDLAAASVADVLRMWKGMGYNRRALYLKKAAEIGTFPPDEETLLAIPGIGRYTARAILVFAYKKDIALVDTNIRRILTHFFFHDRPQTETRIWALAERLVPKGKSWEWHQALMDYGALELERVHTRDHGNAVPFRESNRFFRGRVMDELRIRSFAESVFIPNFSRDYGKSPEDIEGILSGLAKDNLIKRADGMLSLPD